MSKFTEAQLEQAIIELLEEEGYPHVPDETIQRSPEEVLIKYDLRSSTLMKVSPNLKLSRSSANWRYSRHPTCMAATRHSFRMAFC